MSCSLFKLTGVIALGVVCHSAIAQSADAPLSASEAKKIAIEAYIYGYSLITTEVTRVQMTNVDKVQGGLRGPMGKFINVKQTQLPSNLPPGKGTWRPPAVMMVK